MWKKAALTAVASVVAMVAYDYYVRPWLDRRMASTTTGQTEQ